MGQFPGQHSLQKSPVHLPDPARHSSPQRKLKLNSPKINTTLGIRYFNQSRTNIGFGRSIRLWQVDMYAAAPTIL